VTLAEEAHRTIADLRAARLEPQDWEGVKDALDELIAAATEGNETAVRATLLALSRTAFAGKVRRRMPAGGVSAPAVVPTKRTSALPVVGIVCGALLLAVGWQLGGGVVLAGCAVFALFIFGVALAGSRVAHDRPGRADRPIDSAVAAPAAVLAAADAAESRLR
jgi:hypothetical protein